MSKVEEFLELVDGLTSLSPEEAEKVRRKYPLDRRGRVNKKGPSDESPGPLKLSGSAHGSGLPGTATARACPLVVLR